MRHRINVSITPVFHDELQRICKNYGFVNLCEICTALLRVFVDRVNNAEQNKGRRLERNEDLIKQMFAEFENWEPTPQPDIMYKRHQRRNPDNVQPRKPRAAAPGYRVPANLYRHRGREGSRGTGGQKGSAAGTIRQFELFNAQIQ